MPPGWSVKTSLRRLKEWQDLAYGLDQRERGLKPEKYAGKDPAKKRLDHLKAFAAAPWLCLCSHHLARVCFFKAQCSRVYLWARCHLELGFGFSFL